MAYKSYFYLALSFIGGGLTYYFAMKGVVANHGDFSVYDFVRSTWIENDYAKSLTLDFWVGTIAGTFFMLVEGRRLGMKYLWLYLIATVFIAYAFAFPLFLFFRALHLKKQATQTTFQV